MHAGARVVGHEVERDGGLAVRLADQSEHASEREIVHVVRRIVAVRAVLAEARERAIDEPRVGRAQRFIVRAEPLHDAGAESLDDHVGAGGELLEERLALGRLHVQRQRALVAVDVDEGRAALPVRILLSVRWRLDLEDIGAHIREHHPGHFRRWHAGQLQNLDAVKNSHRLLLRGCPLTLPSPPVGERGSAIPLPSGERVG